MRTIKKVVPAMLWIGLIILALSSLACKKQVDSPGGEISQQVKDKILDLGFSISGLQVLDEGYVTEGDIIISASDLEAMPRMQFLRIAGNEQYRTYNLVTGLPRTLTISLSNQLPSTYGAGLDEAIRRFNEENLQLHFQRANDEGDIKIVKAYGNFMALSGLPSPSGFPYGIIKLNYVFIGNGNPGKTFIDYLASLITHEIGHCIGFRHTDYMNRNFSCRGKSVNEGSGSSGAVNIPGTPTSADAASWMLACIGVNQNRPINDNDRIALQYLY